MSEIAQLRTVWSGVAGSPYYTNVFIEPTIGSDLQTCANAWKSFLGDVDANCTTTLTWTLQNEVSIIESTTGQLVGADTITGGTGTGSASGDPLPRATQLLVQWKTNAIVNGRRRHGRSFIPGLIETLNVAPGVPSGTVTAATAAQAGGFITACDGAFIIYSPTHRSFSPVTAATVWDQWAQLRSRRD